MAKLHVRSKRHGGFTAVELMSLVAVVIVAAATLAVILTPSHRSRRGYPVVRDSAQIRGIVQAMVIWAGNNAGKYPLPSELDPGNATLDVQPWEKDTTGHMLSALIWNGNIVPEMCVTPAETNTSRIQRYDWYAYTNPGAAARPADALWDPTFRGTPEDAPIGGVPADAPGHNSYAHHVPIGARRTRWADTFATTEPMFGNRGPTYATDDWAVLPAGAGRWPLPQGVLGSGSNTLLIHGGRTTWEGQVGYNDGHVSLETSPAPAGVVYTRTTASGLKSQAPDNMFVNEWDEAGGDVLPGSVGRGTNAYLRPIARMIAPDRPVLWTD